jgi:hypothetical protein
MIYGTAETKLMKRSNNLVTIWTPAEGVNSSWWAVFAFSSRSFFSFIVLPRIYWREKGDDSITHK